MAPEVTIHDVETIVIEKRAAKTAEGRDYTVINMGIVGKQNQKLFHCTLFTYEGDIDIIEVGKDV